MHATHTIEDSLPGSGQRNITFMGWQEEEPTCVNLLLDLLNKRAEEPTMLFLTPQ